MSSNRRASDRPCRLVVMIALVAVACAFIVGRATGQIGLETVRQAEAKPLPRELPSGIERFHDAANGVTCWLFIEGLSCLPDQWLLTAEQGDQP